MFMHTLGTLWEKKRKIGRKGGDGRRRREPLDSKQGRLYIFRGDSAIDYGSFRPTVFHL